MATYHYPGSLGARKRMHIYMKVHLEFVCTYMLQGVEGSAFQVG
jgi:hypothetical protein